MAEYEEIMKMNELFAKHGLSNLAVDSKNITANQLIKFIVDWSNKHGFNIHTFIHRLRMDTGDY